MMDSLNGDETISKNVLHFNKATSTYTIFMSNLN